MGNEISVHRYKVFLYISVFSVNHIFIWRTYIPLANWNIPKVHSIIAQRPTNFSFQMYHKWTWFTICYISFFFGTCVWLKSEKSDFPLRLKKSYQYGNFFLIGGMNASRQRKFSAGGAAKFFCWRDAFMAPIKKKLPYGSFLSVMEF